MTASKAVSDFSFLHRILFMFVIFFIVVPDAISAQTTLLNDGPPMETTLVTDIAFTTTPGECKYSI